MKNFDYDIKTEIKFGRGQIDCLGESIRKYTDRVLLVYGGGSIKETGAYNDVVRELKNNSIEFVELSGVEPNPRIQSVIKGVELAREHKLSGILAVGGGSVIDCSKVIAGGFFYDGDPWDLVLNRKLITDALPIFTVLTIAATGSEMNGNAVISKLETNEKLGTSSPLFLPKVSIMDPQYTYTVNKWHTACGTADIMSHTLENYFNNEDGAYIQSRLAEAILKTCIHNGPIALKDPENYDARANLMWASSLAINGLLSYGVGKAWSVHAMEHELSAFYDITHGAGLAILTPHWMKRVLDDDSLAKFVDYGVNVWGIDRSLKPEMIAMKAVEKTSDFFKNELKIPMTLTEMGIEDEHIEIMAYKAARGDKIRGFRRLSIRDIIEIYRNAL